MLQIKFFIKKIRLELISKFKAKFLNLFFYIIFYSPSHSTALAPVCAPHGDPGIESFSLYIFIFVNLDEFEKQLTAISVTLLGISISAKLLQ